MREKRIYTALTQWLFITLGNTFGIWFTYIIIDYIFSGLIPELKWPGFYFFIDNGSLLTITFSVLTSIILSTSINLKLNWYNGLSIALLIITTIIYARCIGLNGKHLNTYSSTIPFIVSLILLFFALKDKDSIFRKYSWLSTAKNKAFNYDIFLSFAIAGNKNQKQRIEMENYIEQLDTVLKECGYSSIFNAAKYFDKKHEKQQPGDAAKEDFSAVENSENFILFYPEEVPSSALMELGYALRDKRSILLISKNIHTLPFLARGMSEVNKNVRTIFFDDFNDCLENIRSNHKQYFNS